MSKRSHAVIDTDVEALARAPKCLHRDPPQIKSSAAAEEPSAVPDRVGIADGHNFDEDWFELDEFCGLGDNKSLFDSSLLEPQALVWHQPSDLPNKQHMSNVSQIGPQCPNYQQPGHWQDTDYVINLSQGDSQPRPPSYQRPDSQQIHGSNFELYFDFDFYFLPANPQAPISTTQEDHSDRQSSGDSTSNTSLAALPDYPELQISDAADLSWLDEMLDDPHVQDVMDRRFQSRTTNNPGSRDATEQRRENRIMENPNPRDIPKQRIAADAEKQNPQHLASDVDHCPRPSSPLTSSSAENPPWVIYTPSTKDFTSASEHLLAPPLSPARPASDGYRHFRSSSTTWWGRFRVCPLESLRVNVDHVDELRHTNLSALDALQSLPPHKGVTDNHNSFGRLIHAVWTPSADISVLQIAICIILYIAVPPGPLVSKSRQNHRHRDELPASWAPRSHALHALLKGGSAGRIREVNYNALYQKYRAYGPAAVHEKAFTKRIREVIKFGSCYMLIASYLGLGSLVALRSRLEPRSELMWGCTKGSSHPKSLTSQAFDNAMAHLATAGIPHDSHVSGADVLMHKILWTIGGMFDGFEAQAADAPFPGFEFRHE